MKCRITSSDRNVTKHCVPTKSFTQFHKNGNIRLLKTTEGKIAEIVGEKHGADKGSVKNIKFGNKFYFLYTDIFYGPKIKNNVIMSSKLKTYKTSEQNKLNIVIREIEFLKKASKSNVVPKIFLSELFQKQHNKIKLFLATEDLTKLGFKNIGHYLDHGKIRDISFSKINISNGPDPTLERYIIKNNLERYLASFMNPKFYKRNLEKWYSYNKRFLDHVFKGFYALHRLNIFHHDAHGSNVYYNGKRIMFIDFGRASNLVESFQIRTHEKKHVKAEKKKFSNEKNKKKKLMMAELSKNITNPSGRHEFFRHDIDNKFMVEHCYDRPELFQIVHDFKVFLAEKYAKIN
jgi:hypothetical protein